MVPNRNDAQDHRAGHIEGEVGQPSRIEAAGLNCYEGAENAQGADDRDDLFHDEPPVKRRRRTGYGVHSRPEDLRMAQISS